VLTLVRREIRQNWRTFRLPALYLIFLFLAVTDPLVTKYMGEILARSAHGITVIVPPPSPSQAMIQFLGDFIELGALVIIAITMGSVAGEKASGVTSFMLTKPVSRKSYIVAKILVLGGGAALGMVAATVLAWLYSWSLLGPISFSRIAWAALSAILYAEFILAVTFGASMAVDSYLGAGGIGLLTLFLTSIAGSFLGNSAVGPYLPSTLVKNIELFLSRPLDGENLILLLKSGCCTIVLGSAFVFAGYLRFRREPLP